MADYCRCTHDFDFHDSFGCMHEDCECDHYYYEKGEPMAKKKAKKKTTKKKTTTKAVTKKSSKKKTAPKKKAPPKKPQLPPAPENAPGLPPPPKDGPTAEAMRLASVGTFNDQLPPLPPEAPPNIAVPSGQDNTGVPDTGRELPPLSSGQRQQVTQKTNVIIDEELDVGSESLQFTVHKQTTLIEPPKEKTTKKVEFPILTALKFIKCAMVKTGEQEHTHVRIHQGQVVSYNRVLSAGHPIPQTELTINPHGQTLLDAVKYFGEGDSITQADPITLQVTVGEMVANIPSLAYASFLPQVPDPIAGTAFDTVKDGFKALSKIIKNSGESVVQSSLLLRDQTMLATDNMMLVEYWHGCNLPEVVLPKVFVSAVSKVKAAVAGVGVSPNTFTIHFQDGSWIKTQIYSDPWPDTSTIFPPPNVDPGFSAVPKTLFTKVKKQLPFQQEATVYFSDGWVSSNPSTDTGVRCTVEGLVGVPDPVRGEPTLFVPLNGKSLVLLDGHVDKMVIDPTRVSLFYGEKMRVALYPVLEI